MRFSIVTPSFNQAEYLSENLASVRAQGVDLQHLVIDGGSSDRSVAVLEAAPADQLRWISEPDQGQADAVNKGLRMTDGDVIGWLNSDDLYLPGALATVAKAFEHPQTQWVVGRYQIINRQCKAIRSSIVSYKNRSLDRYTYRKLLRENFIAQPAVFWRADFGRRVGLLDSALHYTLDYDLWLRMGRLAAPVILDQTLASFRVHDSSKTGIIQREQFDEGYRVACRYVGDDRASRWWHRFNVEKIVWAYRMMALVGR